jgi:hypothetical protein
MPLRGEDHPNAKLKNRQVKRIKARLARGDWWWDIAADYAHVVHFATIYCIWRELTWGWLDA